MIYFSKEDRCENKQSLTNLNECSKNVSIKKSSLRRKKRIYFFNQDISFDECSNICQDDSAKKGRIRGQDVHPIRLKYPSLYYKSEKLGKIKLVWSSTNSYTSEPPSFVHQFSESELTPTYHFSESKGRLVLGCEHYARACKLRHPTTGQLYTCRLCCDKVHDSKRFTDDALPVLDRHNVKEVLCMRCCTLQPAGSKCINKLCESHGVPYAKYHCGICNLFDDDLEKSIYHCPYCNVCRKGKGLGIDFRHCMRFNACVAILEYNSHVCIPQRLEGNCPICHETLFESTEPLRGMSCGHVMHLTCFNMYVVRRFSLGVITCPLCKKVFEQITG